MPPDHELTQELGLQNKEIVLYAGTHGYAHGMERILQQRKYCRSRRPQCHFGLVGDGSAKPVTIRQAKELEYQCEFSRSGPT